MAKENEDKGAAGRYNASLVTAGRDDGIMDGNNQETGP